MTKRIIALVLILFAISASCQAQKNKDKFDKAFADSLITIAEQTERKDPDKAFQYYKQAIEYTKKSSTNWMLLRIANNAIKFCNKTYRVHDGIKLCNEISDICNGDTDLKPKDLADFYTWRGDLYNSMGEYEQALGSFYSALDIADTLAECAPTVISACFKAISVLVKAGYEIQEVDYLHECYVEANNRLRHSGLSTAVTETKFYITERQYYMTCANHEMSLLKWDTAVMWYKKSIEETIKKRPHLKDYLSTDTRSWDLSERIETYRLVGDDNEISKLYEIATTELADEVSSDMFGLYYNLGLHYLYKGETSKAKFLFDKAYDLGQKSYKNASAYNFDCLMHLMECYSAEKDYASAKQKADMLKEMIPQLFNTELNNLVMKYYELRGEAEFFDGDTSAIERNLSHTALLLEKLLKYKFGFLNSEEFTEFWSRYNSSCSEILAGALLLDGKCSNDFKKLVYKVELGQKNINFISQNRVKKVSRLSDELRQDYYELLRLKRKLLEIEPMSSADKVALYIQMKFYETELAKHFDTTITNILNVDFDKIKRNLKDGEIAVEFVQVYEYHLSTSLAYPEKCNHDYAAIAFNNKMEAPEIIKLFSKKEIEEFYLNDTLTLARALSERQPSTIAEIYNNKNLSSLIWSRILSKFPSPSKIYFSPTGLLYSLAIENLPTAGNKTMSDTYKMERISSTVMLLPRMPKFMFDDITLFGGINYDTPLEMQKNNALYYIGDKKFTDRYCHRLQASIINGDKNSNSDSIATRKKLSQGYKQLASTYEECDYVAKMANNKQITFIYGDSAVEESFKFYSLKKPNIIHVASHGFFNPNHKTPNDLLSNSGLVFAGANNYLANQKLPRNIDDGFLTASEISELDLSDTRLAVLSACETGLGIVNSDGLFGLERGLKLAGVESILMSLWSISDSATSLFMRKFYGALLSGNTPREALASAQQYLRSGNRFSHPFYWAGFVLLD